MENLHTGTYTTTHFAVPSCCGLPIVDFDFRIMLRQQSGLWLGSLHQTDG
jgi:hypothetical protein